MVIGQSSNTLQTIIDSVVITPLRKLNNERDMNAVSLVSNNWSQKLLKEEKQDETDNTDWQDSIKIPEEHNECREAFL